MIPEITVIRHKKYWLISVDKKTYRISELERYLGAKKGIVRGAMYRLASDAERVSWLQARYMLMERGLPVGTTAYCYNGVMITLDDIRAESGCTYSGSYTRGKLFATGKITKIQAFRKRSAGGRPCGTPSAAMWNGLTNNDRSHNLDKIPGPGKFDKEVNGKYAGHHCLPSVIGVGAGARRY